VQALVFATLLAGVLLVTETIRTWLGERGAIIATGLAGFADAHAAAAAAAQYAVSGAMTAAQSVQAIALALSANALSKTVAGFAGAQRRFGAANAAVQGLIVGLFWLGVRLGTG